MVKLSFHGAAETVTGSKYLLEVDQHRVLIDCGLFQGLKELRERNWKPLPFPTNSVTAVVLTHAHIDHIGYLPRFVKDGYHGPVYCTPATAELGQLLLLDSARNQESDADYANKKSHSKHKPALPLYDARDANEAIKLFRPVLKPDWFNPAGPIFMRYHRAGHLLGSTFIEVEIRDRPQPLRIVFSGDVGRYDAPLYFDPEQPPNCDYLICESTYGDRNHPPQNVLDELAQVVHASIARGGVMLVASFAVGRAQQLIYLLHILIKQKRIPELPIYLDSPMAVDATGIYCHHSDEHDLTEMQSLGDENILGGHEVHLSRTVGESKHINGLTGPAVIIASSGMMTGGRILHHLKQRLPNPKTTVVLAGFQAEGTRGRALQNGARTLRIHGQDVPVRAAIAQMSALSGHAGHDELLRWLAPIATPPKQTFITHGELTSATAFAAELHTTRGWNTVVPKQAQTFEL